MMKHPLLSIGALILLGSLSISCGGGGGGGGSASPTVGVESGQNENSTPLSARLSPASLFVGQEGDTFEIVEWNGSHTALEKTTLTGDPNQTLTASFEIGRNYLLKTERRGISFMTTFIEATRIEAAKDSGRLNLGKLNGVTTFLSTELEGHSPSGETSAFLTAFLAESFPDESLAFSQLSMSSVAGYSQSTDFHLKKNRINLLNIFLEILSRLDGNPNSGEVAAMDTLRSALVNESDSASFRSKAQSPSLPSFPDIANEGRLVLSSLEDRDWLFSGNGVIPSDELRQVFWESTTGLDTFSRIILTPEGKIIGQVSGDTVSGVDLHLVSEEEDGRYQKTTSDANGNFAFESLLPGNYDVIPVVESHFFNPSKAKAGGFDARRESVSVSFESFDLANHVDEVTLTYLNSKISIKDGGVGTDQLTDGSISLAKLSSNVVNDSLLTSDNSVLGGNLIVRGQAVLGPLTYPDTAGNAGQLLQSNGNGHLNWIDADTSNSLADGAVITQFISDNAVTTIKIADGAVTSTKLGQLRLTSDNITDNIIAGDNIVDGTILSADIADGTISTVDLADASVSSAKLGVLKLTSANITDDIIAGDNIVNGTILSADIADGTISTVDLADASVSSEKLGALKLAAGNITDDIIAGDNIVDGTILSGDIADGTISTVDLADASVSSAKLGALKLTSGNITDDIIAGDNIVDGTILSVDIADGTISTVDLADASVTPEKLSANLIPDALSLASNTLVGGNFSVAGTANLSGTLFPTSQGAQNQYLKMGPSGQLSWSNSTSGNVQLDDDSVAGDNIVDGSVLTGDLADGAVTSAKLGTLLLSADNITDNLISSDNIVDGSITTSDLADGAVTSNKLGSLVITSANIADGSVTSAKLGTLLLSADNITDNLISSDNIVDGSITLNDLATFQISTGNLSNNLVSSANIVDGTIQSTDLSENLISNALASSPNVIIGGNLAISGQANLSGTLFPTSPGTTGQYLKMGAIDTLEWTDASESGNVWALNSGNASFSGNATIGASSGGNATLNVVGSIAVEGEALASITPSDNSMDLNNFKNAFTVIIKNDGELNSIKNPVGGKMLVLYNNSTGNIQINDGNPSAAGNDGFSATSTSVSSTTVTVSGQPFAFANTEVIETVSITENNFIIIRRRGSVMCVYSATTDAWLVISP